VAARNKSDQAARFVAKLDPMGFLLWLLPGLTADLRFARWLDTRRLPFPGEPDRVCDTLAALVHVTGAAPPRAVVVEFERTARPDKLERLFLYALQAREDLRHGPGERDKYEVTAALVNLSRVHAGDTFEMTLPGTSLHLRGRAGVRNLETEQAAATLADIAGGKVARCVLPWIPLMADGGEESIITEWKRVASQETDTRRRDTFAGLALIFADLTRRRPTWRVCLKEWNVEDDPPIVREWQAEALQDALLKMLHKRFPGGLPEDLLGAIRAQLDPDRVTGWFDAAVDAPTLDQFRGSTGLSNGAARPTT
jgi:hypothetical protein